MLVNGAGEDACHGQTSASGCRLGCCADGSGPAGLARRGRCARRPFAWSHRRRRHCTLGSERRPARQHAGASGAGSSGGVAAASTPTSAAPGSTVKSITTLPAPASPPPPTPASAIGAPAPQLQALAPLSPAVTTTTLTAGGSGRPDATASPTPSSSSPSESAPSTAGGGGKSLQDCMGYWDSQTHMTKAEWRSACMRSVNRLANLKPETVGLGPPSGKR
jgi:hypothetical protein